MSGLLLCYLLLISRSPQNEIQTAGERVHVGFTFMFTVLINRPLCPCMAGVCELQLLWEVHLLQLLGDASPGPGLQPVRCKRLTH